MKRLSFVLVGLAILSILYFNCDFENSSLEDVAIAEMIAEAYFRGLDANESIGFYKERNNSPILVILAISDTKVQVSYAVASVDKKIKSSQDGSLLICAKKEDTFIRNYIPSKSYEHLSECVLNEVSPLRTVIVLTPPDEIPWKPNFAFIDDTLNGNEVNPQNTFIDNKLFWVVCLVTLPFLIRDLKEFSIKGSYCDNFRLYRSLLLTSLLLASLVWTTWKKSENENIFILEGSKDHRETLKAIFKE